MPASRIVRDTIHRLLSMYKLRHCIAVPGHEPNFPQGTNEKKWLHAKSDGKSSTTPLVDYLTKRIKAEGPLTVADYMKEVLTNPLHGYYMKQDVFGLKGDFITSPEISQLFGELIGVWIVNEWDAIGRPSRLQIVELGPGRGTLASDILRTINQFDFMKGVASLHLIDISPKMRQLQAKMLIRQSPSDVTEGVPYTAKHGHCPVYWHQSLADIPRFPTCVIAHEFFDALPIHKFQRTSAGWREVLVDVAPREHPHHFQFVLAPQSNANDKLFVSITEKRSDVEVCPAGGVVIQEIAHRINLDGGFALLADYGHNGEKGDTFRAFKSHKLHDPLEAPGNADLTADVDFQFLKLCVKNTVKTYGPTTQQEFLHNMGISTRLKKLLSSPSCTGQQQKDLLTAYEMLCSPEKMGQRFKFFCLYQSNTLNHYVPAGFVSMS